MADENYPQSARSLMDDLVQRFFGREYRYGSIWLRVKNGRFTDMDLKYHLKPNELENAPDDKNSKATRRNEHGPTVAALIEMITKRLCAQHQLISGEIAVHAANAMLTYVAITVVTAEDEMS